MKGLQVEAPNRCWVADSTYVRLPEGFVYLACILDIYSHKCIGWSLSRSIDVQLPLQALEMAWAQRQVSSGLYQYQTFEEAQARLKTFLEDVYNTKRLHSSLDHMPPDEFELKYTMC